MKDQVEKLEQIVKLMESAYLTLRKSEKTNLIIQEDDTRDSLITGIQKMAEAYTYHPESDYKDSAHLLLNEIGKYGESIARMNYQAETAA